MHQVRELNATIDGRSDPWPYGLEDSNPLGWWRMLPPDAFGAAEHLGLSATLERVTVLHAAKSLPAALKGDPAAAVAVALSLLPLERVDLQVDIAMSSLLHCALKDDAAAALVLSHMLGRAEFDHPLKIELSILWLTRHLGRARDPRWFAQTEARVSQALCEQEAALEQ